MCYFLNDDNARRRKMITSISIDERHAVGFPTPMVRSYSVIDFSSLGSCCFEKFNEHTNAVADDSKTKNPSRLFATSPIKIMTRGAR